MTTSFTIFSPVDSKKIATQLRAHHTCYVATLRCKLLNSGKFVMYCDFQVETYNFKSLCISLTLRK